ncbi:MAG: hypothetical protein RLZZ234_43 [Candidatus Parcubacteria bacterium]|jgi:hypothetical protein
MSDVAFQFSERSTSMLFRAFAAAEHGLFVQ